MNHEENLEAMQKCERIIDRYMQKAKAGGWSPAAMQATQDLSFEIWDVAYELGFSKGKAL